jgi:hypothetical protein
MDEWRILRQRGAPAEWLDALAASGLPAGAACGAIERVSPFNRLRRWFSPRARLSGRELMRLKAVVQLAEAVAKGEGGPAGAARFRGATMPWLDGRTPADWLARGRIGVVEDLRARIDYGIPP